MGEPVHAPALGPAGPLSAPAPIVPRAMPWRSRTLLACFAAIPVASGCGGSHGKTIRSGPSAEGRQPALRQAPPSTGITVKPLTTKPGGRIRVVVRVSAARVDVTLSGNGGHVAARAAARGADRFVVSLAVPRKLRGGFWPVVATYRGTSVHGALRTQVKVVTP